MPDKWDSADGQTHDESELIATDEEIGYWRRMTWDALSVAEVRRILARLDAAERRVKELETYKDRGYEERQRLVVGLSRLFPSWLGRHFDDDPEWERDWMNIVYVQLPTGQASWHIHDSQLGWFAHLSRDDNKQWDGHTDAQKYERIASLEPISELEESYRTAERERDALKAALKKAVDLQDVMFGIAFNSDEGYGHRQSCDCEFCEAFNALCTFLSVDARQLLEEADCERD